MATLKKQRRIDTDNRIKAAAVEVFAEYGYERAQLSYMSKIAGISIGLIGQNFGSKQDLFMAVVRDGYDNLHKVFNSTACNIIVSCNKNNIALPEDEWFLSLVRK